MDRPVAQGLLQLAVYSRDDTLQEAWVWQVGLSGALVQQFNQAALLLQGRDAGESARGKRMMAYYSVEMTINALEDAASEAGIPVDAYAGEPSARNRGTPDLYILYRGDTYLAEVKSSRETVSMGGLTLARRARAFGPLGGRAHGYASVRVDGHVASGMPPTISVVLLRGQVSHGGSKGGGGAAQHDEQSSSSEILLGL